MRLKKIGILFSILFAIAGLTASVALITITDFLHRATVAIEKSVESVYAAEELEIAIVLHNRDLFLADMTGEERYKESAKNYEQQISALLEESRKLKETPEEDKQLRIVEDRALSYLTETQRLAGSDLSPSEAHLRFTTALENAYKETEELVRISRAKGLAKLSESAWHNQLADYLGIFAIGLLVALITASLILGNRYLLRPMVTLRDSVRAFGRGDLKSRFAHNGPKELAEIGTVFNEMAESLERTRNSQVRFLASVAHDIRNPLSAIKTSADFLRIDDEMERSEQRYILEIISRQVALLDSLVGDLLDVAKAESGQMQIRQESRDICRIIEDSARIHENVSQAHTIEVLGTGTPILCPCDGVRISQVINNLLSNAIKYTPHGGKVTIDCQRLKSDVQIAVRDEGLGIDPDELETIFEPFRRSKVTIDTIPGVGLGLSTSKKIVELHGGRITVESKKGKGSVFKITLPLEPLNETRSTPPLTLVRPGAAL